MRIVLLKVCVFILLANNLFSQERTQRDSLVQTLDSVLVIGQHESNKLSRAVPFLIGQQDNLINALDALPEIRKIHENGYPIVLRGMHGNRLRIENNGALRTGIVEQGYLLDDINPENIGRIETITGIESVISGSGSIGGIIRIESKKASEKRTGSIFLKAETNNGSRGIGLNLSNGLKALKYRLSARHFQTQNFQYGNREEATNSASNQLNLKLSTAYAKSEKLKLTWNNEYTQAEFQRPRGFQNNPNELRTFRNNYSFQSDLHIENKTKGMARLDHDIWYLAQDYDQLINNFNFDFSQLNVEENRNYQKQSAGYRVKLSSENSVNQEFLVGADAILNMLDERRRRNDLLNPSFSEEFLGEKRILFGHLFFMETANG